MSYLNFKKDIWVTSDTHFFHENIIMYCGRPFRDADQMNEILVENWNSIVKPGDKVYHLGDVFMGSNNQEKFKRLWPRLNGQKRLIVGNHDDIKFLSSGGFFKKVNMWRMFPEYECVLTHVPIRLDEDGSKYRFNLHGHIHDNFVTYDNGNKNTHYFNCCVEHHNYTPIHLQSTMEKVQKGFG